MRAVARHVRRALLWAAVMCLLMTAAYAGDDARTPGRSPYPFWSVLVVSLTMGPAFYVSWCGLTASWRAKKAGR